MALRVNLLLTARLVNLLLIIFVPFEVPLLLSTLWALPATRRSIVKNFLR
jgi:hypothetical protein